MEHENELPKREEDKIGNVGCTLQEIADKLGISRERVRQIEAVALRKLRMNPKARELFKLHISKSNPYI